MLSLYEILKASKTGIAPDMWTALAGRNWSGSDSGHEIKELTGIPPLSFRADGTPLLDFLISGNMAQSGTPSPSSIIMPSECGDKTGNLFDYKTAYTSYIQPNGDVSGTANQIFNVKNYIEESLIGKEITISINVKICNSVNVIISSYINGVRTNGSTVTRGNTGTLLLTVTPQTTNDYWFITYGSGGSDVDTYSDFMLNSGSTAIPYEPYGIEIPILSNSTTTPVYLGEVETTRNVAKYVLTGEENIDYYSTAQGSLFRRIIGGTIGQEIYGYAICTHYSVTTVAARANNTLSGNASTINTNLDFIDNRYNSAADFKAYLQQQYANGTPVCVWYVLATPITGIVNEPLRKIGDYADTLSMEQAGVSIPTLNGQTVVDVDTTLKPSEMYIKYQG